MHKLILAYCFVFITSVAISVSASDNAPVNSPPLNTESTAIVGEEILHQGIFYERDVIHLSREIKIGENAAYTLSPGYYLRTGGDAEWDYYVPAKDDPNGGKVTQASGVVTLQEAFQVSADGKTVGVITNYYQAVRGEATGITRSTRPSLSTESFQKALVYGGKSGNMIKLAYKEIWMNIIRPSELQFVECDISKSNIVEFHGARIEVLRSTKDSIRYRVINSFSETEN